jgi:hypothetical protein
LTTAHKAADLPKARKEIMEEWKELDAFPDYAVSTSGEVKRISTGRILAHKVNQYGVVYVGLMRAYKQRQRSVALLVANTFLERPSSRMDTPINLNGDRHDNRLENLAWRPRWYAVYYNRQFKAPYENPINESIIDLGSREIYRDSWQCAIANGLLERDVVLSILNRTLTAVTYQQFDVLSD